MSNLNGAKYTDSNGEPHIFIYNLPGWNGFDRILNYLKEECGAEVLSNNVDDDDFRDAILNLEEYSLHLSYDDLLGNVLWGTDKKSTELLKQIAADLNERFR